MALVGSTNITTFFLQSLWVFVFNKLNGVLSPMVSLFILDFLPKIQTNHKFKDKQDEVS